jgi:DNA ligase D-like protein (predicted ligase)
MLAETSEPFDSEEYYFEPKWDGLRCIAYLRNGKVELQNRNLTMVTKSYPELAEIGHNVASNAAVLDGEVVILENGLPSFEALQNRFGVDNPIQVRTLSRKAPTTYIAFDLLHLNGRDIVKQPLSYRRQKLASIIRDGPHLIVSQYIPEKGKSYFQKAVQLGFEGVMAKRAGSTYQMGARTRDWLKIKQVKTMDCIIAGFTEGTGSRTPTFGALVLAAYGRDRNLTHLGNVGTGFTDVDMKRLLKIFKPIKTRRRTITDEVKAPSPITWVKPKLVAEVGYSQITRDGKLRLPRFIRLRLDGEPGDCTL